MITTRRLFAKIEAGKRKLERVTTKTIDASIKVIKPKKKPTKSPLISTHNLGDIQDIAERNKRIKITADRKKRTKKPTKKKAWKEMTDAEKKDTQRERMAKARAAKKKKEAKQKS